MNRIKGESKTIRVKYKLKGEYPKLLKNAKKATLSEYIRAKTLE